jgi:tetratricopeptide (TPR) repeat protein
MFERPKNNVAESDRQAQQYFVSKQWQKSLEQNRKTVALLGHETPETLRNEAICWSMLLNPEKALASYQRACEMQGCMSVQDYNKLADYLSQAGQLDQAEQLLKSIDSDDFQILHDLAMHMLRHQNYQAGFRLLSSAKRQNNILWIGQEKYNRMPVCARWQGQDLSGKSVCLIGECGMGDQIMYSRWIPDLLNLANNVYYLTDNSLSDVFCANWPQLKPYTDKTPSDFWLLTGDLPEVFSVNKISPEPYLKPDPVYLQKWSKILPFDKPCVAVTWQGSSEFSQNHFRSIDIDFLMTHLKSYNVINLCLESQHNPENAWDFRNQITCWSDTLAILSLCEKCYSSCTSLAHAAGALGIPTNVYTRPDDWFTWSPSESGNVSTWYSSVTVWRTKYIGHWHSVIDQSMVN